MSKGVFWDVILWLDENEETIDYVPSSWSNNEQDNCLYKYPRGLSEVKIRQLIIECRDLPEGNYEWMKAAVKLSKVKTLERAKKCTESGQYTSTLDVSSSDHEENFIRKKHKPKRFEDNSQGGEADEDEEEEEYEEDMENSENGVQKNTTKVFNRGSPDCRIEKSVSREDSEVVRKSFNIPVKYVDGRKTAISQKNVPEVAKRTIALNHGLSLDGKEAKKLDVFKKASCLSGKKDSANTDLNVLLQGMKTDIKDIKFEISTVKKLLDTLVTKINRIDSDKASPATHADALDELNVLLPCENIETLEMLEEKLKDEKTRKNLVVLLYLVGGDDIHKSTYLVMSKVLGKKVALEYSGQGKKKKRPFNKLTLNNVVLEAVRKRYSSATETEVNRHISLFLATSKSRLPPSDKERNDHVE